MFLETKGVFESLREDSKSTWKNYVGHSFVEALGKGNLPLDLFKRYLQQDYLFLIDFARAWGLAAFKSDNIVDIRSACSSLNSIVNIEINFHVEYCSKWGIKIEELEQGQHALETRAYIEHVFQCGLNGGLLDLHVALAPCIIGYGEIGQKLKSSAFDNEQNPYLSWIQMYSGNEYQSAVELELNTLNRLFESFDGSSRYSELLEIFRESTRLESEFWDVSLDPKN